MVSFHLNFPKKMILLELNLSINGGDHEVNSHLLQVFSYLSFIERGNIMLHFLLNMTSL